MTLLRNSETERLLVAHLGSRAGRFDSSETVGTRFMNTRKDVGRGEGQGEAVIGPAAQTPERHWVRIEAAADWLGCKVCFLRRLVAERRIPYSKAGKYLLFDLHELDDWVQSHRVEPLS